MTRAELRDAILAHLRRSLATEPELATGRDWRLALSLAVRDRAAAPWLAAMRATRESGARRVYYLSMEFLIGRMLEDAIVNLGLGEAAEGACAELGLDLREIAAGEPDAALGNGGLGRLAACFLDSLATVGCPAMGYGLRYEHGLFHQEIEDGRQVETPEHWLRDAGPWEVRRPGADLSVGFGGETRTEDGHRVWRPVDRVLASAVDRPVIGWRGRFASTLRLWTAHAPEPFDLARFNSGDIAGASEAEMHARAITRVLYPEDSTEPGTELRLRQEYFLTAAALADILRRFEHEHGDARRLPQKAAIQLNDTHPAIAGPELVRLLHDGRGVELGEAIGIARATLSYTNHTLLPEALESWPEELFGRLLPRHLELVEAIDAAEPEGRRVPAIADGEVGMGRLAFVMAHRVNGVSALHTELMKETVFRDLHALHPDRIVNQTNGITPRRWLLGANPRLAALVTETIGEGWVDDLERLSGLEPYLDDAGFLDGFAAAKRANKGDLAGWLADRHGIAVDPQAMFDIQIKRIHEYKRQHMNILEAVALWQEIRDAPDAGWTPRVKIFAGKAAPGYDFAKAMIRLMGDVAGVLNADPVTGPYLKVVFLPNYNVSLAERLIPAADLSQQISTAGKEASGTGNMKFALNGAPTIGTLDGANIEIRDRVGAENFFLFGMTAAEVAERRAVPGHAAEAVAADPRLARALEAVADGSFAPGEPDRHRGVADNLRGEDPFLVASDFAAYWQAGRRVDATYGDGAAWWRVAAANTARSGWFSSDRTVRGYMADIWGAEPLAATGGPPAR